MLVVKENPTGIDVSVQTLQQRIYTELLSKWGLGATQYDCYGRCYRNRTKDGFVAEWFVGGKDYRDAFWDDSRAVVSFFGEGDRSDNESGNLSTNIHLVFFVNLEKIKPKVLHRADAEARGDVIGVVGGANLLSAEIGIDNVLREYPGSRRAEGLKSVDMHPVHCFRLNINLKYDPLQCIGAKIF